MDTSPPVTDEEIDRAAQYFDAVMTRPDMAEMRATLRNLSLVGLRDQVAGRRCRTRAASRDRHCVGGL